MNPDIDKKPIITSADVSNAALYTESSGIRVSNGLEMIRDGCPEGTVITERAIKGYTSDRGLSVRLASRQVSEAKPRFGPFHREDLAGNMAEAITGADCAQSTTEIQRHQGELFYRLGAQFNKHPLVMALGSTMAAMLTGAGVISDYLPLDGTTLVLIASSSTLGTERLIRGIQDAIQVTVGSRSRARNPRGYYFSELEANIAAHQEHRVSIGERQESPVEKELLNERKRRMSESMLATLDTFGTHVLTAPADKADHLRTAYNSLGDRLQQRRLQTALFNRWANLARGAIAFGFAFLTTYGVMANGHQDTPLVWRGLDPQFHGQLSSWHGKIQGFIGEDSRLANIPNFDPHNPNHNPTHAGLLESYREKNPIEYSRIMAAFDRYSRSHGRLTTVQADLVSHLAINRVPSDTPGFIKGVLGETTGDWRVDLLNKIKYARYN